MRMANDIANNIRSGKTVEESAEAIANHLRRFWTPGMREKFLELCEESSTELEADVRLAAKQL
ncbi:MAG: formate dehydrogenase subunit delta [Gammaproteobacteria bacterium]|nr:formate dehydrogenase subunit delta [Gammaproteobacteria bacterium]